MDRSVVDDGDGISIDLSESTGTLGMEMQDDEASVTPMDDFVARETRQVCAARTCLVLMLLVVTVLVSFTVFYTLRRNEDLSMESAYEGDSKVVIDAFILNLETQLRVLADTSVALTSYATLQNGTWPFVSHTDLIDRGSNILGTTDAMHFSFYPELHKHQLKEWENFTHDNLDWAVSSTSSTISTSDKGSNNNEIREYVWGLNSAYQPSPVEGDGPFFPMWQNFPIIPQWINFNLYDFRGSQAVVETVIQNNNAVFSRFGGRSVLLDQIKDTDLFSQIVLLDDHPIFQMTYPVFDKVRDIQDQQLVGVLSILFYWETSMSRIDVPDMTMVMQSECRLPETYQFISGEGVKYLGVGDLHDARFESFKTETDVAKTVFETGIYSGVQLDHEFCPYTFTLYPTEAYYEVYHTTRPTAFAVAVVGIFFVTSLLLFHYDNVVENHKKAAIEKHAKQEHIVSSLFPKHIREKLYKGGAEPQQAMESALPEGLPGLSAPMTIVSGNEISMGPMTKHDDSSLALKPLGKPIAELFRETTVFFLEVVGFDAWSSMRDPSEVFTLLQTLFQSFDGLARKLGVFKVETVGESYVAVTGLPEPQEDHAVRMARFARECLNRFSVLTRELEVELGPDTGDLQVKIGLHSGPVTAGVLKGEKSRFQLFGDTMNTSSRMMSTCKPNRIQCSVATADHIIFADKDKWLQEREDRVQAKGKGEVQTYWILPRARPDGTNLGDEEIQEVDDIMEYAVPIVDISAQIHQKQRLIDWHVSLLMNHLKRIAARRAKFNNRKKKNQRPVDFQFREGSTAIDEVTEVIQLPTVNIAEPKGKQKKIRPEDIELDFAVIAQLRDYVTTIASMYRENSFHNFEHATHVTMSTNKLLKRVVSPVEEGDEGDDLHEYTYGITSNPLTQFALVFCALIHDVDHAGVSNFQLIKENAPIARLYKHRSVAEQNSVDISWDLLMDPVYEDLRAAIYESEEELQHFRQLVVNIVLATDIFDKHMKTIRDNRWDKAFDYMYSQEEQPEAKEDDGRVDRKHKAFDGLSLKATIVMEHLIQASDVAHTMQHWDIYLKWNERLFQEMSLAYQSNRSEKDPAPLWYEGEIMFFDKYIIPLAKKLADCGVFGVSSDECLNYALQNRALWAARGDEIVEKFKETLASKPKRKTSMRP